MHLPHHAALPFLFELLLFLAVLRPQGKYCDKIHCKGANQHVQTCAGKGKSFRSVFISVMLVETHCLHLTVGRQEGKEEVETIRSALDQRSNPHFKSCTSNHPGSANSACSSPGTFAYLQKSQAVKLCCPLWYAWHI